MKRIIFLNGPPRSGKDTTAKLIRNNTPAQTIKFAQPLYDAACWMFKMTQPELERKKDTCINPEYPYTYRNFMQDLSEKVIKSNLGKDFFGKLAATKISESSASVIGISDAGFTYEVESCVNELAKKEVCFTAEVWRVHRPGYTFEGDTREWVTTDLMLEEDIYNDGSIDDLNAKTVELLNR